MSEETQSFEPFAKEAAYIHVNEKLVERLMKHLPGIRTLNLLDLASATGLMTSLTDLKARGTGIKLNATLVDIDKLALRQAQKDVTAEHADYICASADHLPLHGTFDAVIFANSIHMLENDAKAHALAETMRVLRTGGVLAINSAFYDGSYPEDSKPFYGRWIRRAIVEINKRLPQRTKSEKVAAIDFLDANAYRDLVTGAGFKIVEMRERRVRLSQAAVRAISAYKEFAKGALHATDEDADVAVAALQVTVQQTFNDLRMRYLPRNWLEIVAVKA